MGNKDVFLNTIAVIYFFLTLFLYVSGEFYFYRGGGQQRNITSKHLWKMVDSVEEPGSLNRGETIAKVEFNTEYGQNLMVIPSTNQIKELQTIIRDK